MNKFNAAVASLYTIVLKAALNRSPAFIVGAVVFGSLAAFFTYWAVGLLAGGIVKGAVWMAGVSLVTTLLSAGWKTKIFHNWKAAVNELSQAVMSAVMLGALIAAPTMVVLVVCHFGFVAIVQLTQKRFNDEMLKAMGVTIPF